MQQTQISQDIGQEIILKLMELNEIVEERNGNE